MNSREFFAHVCKMRNAQKHIAYYGTKDAATLRECRRLEEECDREIKRTLLVLKNQGQSTIDFTI